MGFCVSRGKSPEAFYKELESRTESAVIFDSTCYPDIQKHYTFEAILRRSYVGTLRSALAIRTQLPVAVLSLVKTAAEEEERKRKAKLTLFRLLDHPNILKFYETYEDQRFLHVVMELCTGGTLTDRVLLRRGFREQEVQELFAKLVRAVIHIHANGLVHRDLRPDNIRWATRAQDSECKIADFADLTFTSAATNNVLFGDSADYLAPEQIEGKSSPYSDIWSLGGILYFLLSGEPPFGVIDSDELPYRMIVGDLDFSGDGWESVSAPAKDLVRCMMREIPDDRLSLKQVLRHKWMTTNALNPSLTMRSLKSLMTSKPPKRLQRDLLRAVIKYSSQAKLKRLSVRLTQDMFTALDVEHTGKIAGSALKKAFEGSGLMEPEIEGDVHAAVLNALACSAGETISYTDFLMAALHYQRVLTEDTAFLAFKYFDLVSGMQDNNGFITCEEMITALRNLGSTILGEEVKQQLLRFTKDGEVCIDFEQFQELIGGWESQNNDKVQAL